MLSEFEISKPLPAFNQVHMDPEESLLDSLDSVLLCPGPKAIPGQLHLASRSVYFQPSDSRVGLIRLKYSDDFSFQLLSMAKTLQNFEDEKAFESQTKFWEGLWFILFRRFLKASEEKQDLRNSAFGQTPLQIPLAKSKKHVFRIQASKLVAFERNPPKGYAVHHLQCDFHFLMNGFVNSRESFSGALALSHLSLQNNPSDILTSRKNTRLLKAFNVRFANAKKSRVFYSLQIKSRPCPEEELSRFKLARFSSILKKLAKFMKEDPIVEKLKEMRFQVFKTSLKRFGLNLLEPQMSVSQLGLAKVRSKPDLLVTSARNLQRNLEFLSFKLSAQYEEESARKVGLKGESNSKKGANSFKIRKYANISIEHFNYFKWLCKDFPDLPQESKHEFLFVLPCINQELFEHFFCAIFGGENSLIIKPLLNITKDVSREIQFSDVKHVFPYQMVDGSPGIEIFLNSTLQTILLSFQIEEQRDLIYETLQARSPALITPDLQNATKCWMQGMLPSFDYLMLLNRLSNRSFQDVCQYPIFPWVISDFFSDQFVKNEKAQYRPLADPLGVLSGARRQRADELFQAISSDKRKFKKPFHQGVFVSTPGYIMFFYMRAVPSLVVRLQSSAFSPPEKIFKSFESLWSSIHSLVNYPVELIPEFFCTRQSQILLNRYGITLGSKSDYTRIL